VCENGTSAQIGYSMPHALNCLSKFGETQMCCNKQRNNSKTN